MKYKMEKLILFVTILAVPTTVLAERSVYLNGVKIDTLRNQSFDKVDVKIDDKGNVRISSEEYDVKIKQGDTDSGTPTADLKPPTRKYWLVSEDFPGTNFDVSIRINGQVVASYISGGPKLIKEITKHLYLGNNRVEFITRQKQGTVISPGARLKIYVGEGRIQNNAVQLEEPQVFSRTAGQTSEASELISLQAK